MQLQVGLGVTLALFIVLFRIQEFQNAKYLAFHFVLNMYLQKECTSLISLPQPSPHLAYSYSFIKSLINFSSLEKKLLYTFSNSQHSVDIIC